MDSIRTLLPPKNRTCRIGVFQVTYHYTNTAILNFARCKVYEAFHGSLPPDVHSDCRCCACRFYAYKPGLSSTFRVLSVTLLTSQVTVSGLPSKPSFVLQTPFPEVDRRPPNVSIAIERRIGYAQTSST